MKPKHLLICLACLLLLAAPAAAAGGDGTSANPYQIETAVELQSIQNDLSAHYILMNDIDLTGVTWTPIGSTSAGFFGELDGNGKTISNLNISSSSSYTGLFAVVYSGGMIKNLVLENSNIVSSSSNTGLLCGGFFASDANQNNITINNIDIINCAVNGNEANCAAVVAACRLDVNADITNCNVINCNIQNSAHNVGGIAGYVEQINQFTMSDCTVLNTYVEGTRNTGGIVGNPHQSGLMVITNVKLDSSIVITTSSYYVGGIIGSVSGGSAFVARDCIVQNSIIKSQTTAAGGICGVITSLSSGEVSNCDVLDSSVVATGNYAGGIAGRVQSGTTGVFTDCTVTGCSILANAYAAGVCPAYS